jgi:pimeloyl-ACP methyl ester carboxylesterase
VLRGLVLSLLVVTTATADARPALHPCRIKGLSGPAQCGSLDVPEDRAHPERRTLHLKFALLRSLARSPSADPLFLLAGGPGQSGLESLGPLAEGPFAAVRQERDLVLVDLRGTGGSNPLECRLLADDAPLPDRFRDDLLSAQSMSACAKRWSADLSQYTTPAAAQDLDELRAALGYQAIDLWGASYGTRAALVYLREHGAHVRAAVLDGVAPLQLVLPRSLARDAQRALDLLLDSCAADAACKAAFPDLRARLEALLAQLARAPARVTVAHPLTGVPTQVTISRAGFAGALRGQLYLPDLAALMPLTIDRATRGDWAPFVAQNAGLEGGFVRGMYLGLLFATTCAEDLPYTSASELEEAARGSFLGAELARDWLRTCAAFPAASPRPGFRDPVRSEVPTLLLSGELDPVTPPSWAEEARKTLPRSLHVIMPGVGHGVSAHGCVPRLIARFLAAGTTAGLDPGCVAQSTRPPFFVTFAGPRP